MAEEQWWGRIIALLEEIRDRFRDEPDVPGLAPPLAVPDVPNTPATGPSPINGTAGEPGARTPAWTVRTSVYPARVWQWHQTVVTAGTPVEAGPPFPVPAPGTLTIAGAVSTATVWQVSVDGGETYYPLQANPVPAGVWTEATVSVVAGDQVQVSLAADATVQDGRVVYRPT